NAGFEVTGRIPENKVGDYIFFTCDFKAEKDLIHEVSIAQAKDDYYINKLIRFSGVEFVEAGSTYYDEYNVIGGATNRNLRDDCGTNLIFRTGSFATY